MCQSRLSLLISHWVHEKILKSGFRWYIKNDMETFFRSVKWEILKKKKKKN